MRLLDEIRAGRFCVILEFTPHSAADVRRLADIGRRLPGLNIRYGPRGLVVPAVTLTQNPGGSPSYDHQAALAILRENGWPEEIELIPHVTGKDQNSDSIASALRAMVDRGVRTVLALTGDVPSGKGVFEFDSLGLLSFLRRVNADLLRPAKDDEAFNRQPLLEAGAAVSPFKYTPGSLAMQLIKASKKIREGAAFLACQAGWDARRSEQLIAELRDTGVPLIGNAMVVNDVAARHMQSLPGCVIADDFIRRLQKEGEEDNLSRSARQIAMFRALGYAGADLGRPGDFTSIAPVERILDEALSIGDWTAFRDDLTFAPPDAPAPAAGGGAGFSWAVHRAVFEEEGSLHGVARAVLKPFNRSAEREGALYRLFRSMEDFGKGLAYECGHCGDCFLPENQYVCTMGQCEKGLANVPCGDADPQGRCGNNKDRICAGEKVYGRLLKRKAVEEFRRVTMPPRRPALEGSSSVLNYFFGRDHNARPRPLAGSGLVQVAELVHASIPYAGAALRHMESLGPAGFDTNNRGRLAVEALVREQAEQGGDFIDLNIDALSGPDKPGFMRRLVRLVLQSGGGVPPCVDSSDPAVLEAGLDEWLGAGADLPPPLVNSVTFSETERYAGLLARRTARRFGVVCLLVGREGPLKSADEMTAAAREMFRRCRRDGFEPGDLFFDTVTLGIGTDSFLDAAGDVKPSHTHNSFRAIRAIREDAEMKGVHALLGVSNWVYGAAKRRIGHLRAFIEVAREYGLDAVIADASKEFGLKPAPPELMDLVRMFASLDGGEASMDRYTDTIAAAREAGWV